MAVVLVPKTKIYICDTEAERSFDFGNGSFAYTLDTNTLYFNDAGVWITINGGGGVTDGDKGDITVSAGGTVWTIDNGVVTALKTSITGTPSGSKYLRDDFSWQTVAGGSFTLTETEVDFGTKPIPSKVFTITDAGASGTSKITAFASGNVATGRVGNDNEWDTLTCSCKSGTGTFELTVTASGFIAGKRKIFYNIT